MYDYVTLGKLALAVASFPIWEVGAIAVKIAVGKAKTRKEDLAFLPRVIGLMTGICTLGGAFMMCYPILSLLKLIRI